MIDYYAVILAGGEGARFWPASRRATPKQFLPILGDAPLITQTADRLIDGAGAERVFIITNVAQEVGTRKHCPSLPEANIIAEPVGRNTAPCVGLAAMMMQVRSGGDPILGVFPADAWITPTDSFTRDITKAVDLAAREATIVTIGIPPARPATGYGYIQAGDAVNGGGRRVAHFIEKPDLPAAEKLVASGDCTWNAGIFIFRASVVLDELARQQPDILASLEELRPHIDTPTMPDALATAYDTMPAISFDYAVMEHAQSICVVEASFTWDDLGSWAALARHLDADSDGNVCRGPCLTVDAHGNTVSGKRMIALLGVDDLIVVETDDAVLVCHKDRAEEVKQVVQALDASGHDHLR